jgi:CheY-like chemotaxis protein
VSERILVVDDTPHNVKVLADLLAAKGYVVEPARRRSTRPTRG